MSASNQTDLCILVSIKRYTCACTVWSIALGKTNNHKNTVNLPLSCLCCCCIMVKTENSPARVLLMCHGVNRKQSCLIDVSLCEQKTALCCWCVMVRTENSPVLLMCYGVNRRQPCVVVVSLCEQKTALCCWCVMV